MLTSNISTANCYKTLVSLFPLIFLMLRTKQLTNLSRLSLIASGGHDIFLFPALPPGILDLSLLKNPWPLFYKILIFFVE